MSNAAEIVDEPETTNLMELDAKTKLRRFCFLGSLEPVYSVRCRTINYAVLWPLLKPICNEVDDLSFGEIMRDVLKENTIPRRGNAMFVYAAYLASDVKIEWKTSVRKVFAILFPDDDDLFLFCRYAMFIQVAEGRKGFSRTARKAITLWYEQHRPEHIRDMWLTHRGKYGFTHKALIKMCHINDTTIGAPGIATPFFKSCTQLLKAAESDESATKEPTETTTTPTANAIDSEETTEMENVATAVPIEKTKPTVEVPNSLIVSMSTLRTTKSKRLALEIIRKFKFHYHQIPKHFLFYPSVMESVIPSMSYWQLLKCWRHLGRHNLFEKPKILKLCEHMLRNKELLTKSNIHPILFLIQKHRLGIRKNFAELPMKRVKAMRMHFFQELYDVSFGNNQKTGLRIHITINLQENYRKKFLKNYKKMSYYDAAIVLAFGYFKTEEAVDVHYWAPDEPKLESVPWTKDMELKDAIECCDKIKIAKNTKNSQRLFVPITNSSQQQKVYDLFLSIVPAASRGNPKNQSELLCKFIDRYRQNKNPNAKYVIVDLLRFRRSMAYSETRKENILEICGLNEHTPNLIANFALNRFD